MNISTINPPPTAQETNKQLSKLYYFLTLYWRGKAVAEDFTSSSPVELPFTPGIAEFRRILVDQNERGIGQESIDKMEDYSRYVLGARSIWLDVYADNLKGIHIYENLGYPYFQEDSINGRKLLYYQKTL